MTTDTITNVRTVVGEQDSWRIVSNDGATTRGFLTHFRNGDRYAVAAPGPVYWLPDGTEFADAVRLATAYLDGQDSVS
jgi:hypothetical protein